MSYTRPQGVRDKNTVQNDSLLFSSKRVLAGGRERSLKTQYFPSPDKRVELVTGSFLSHGTRRKEYRRKKGLVRVPLFGTLGSNVLIYVPPVSIRNVDSRVVLLQITSRTYSQDIVESDRTNG